MERRPAVWSKCGVGILHVCQVKDHHQERSDNNIDCSPSHLAHYIKKTVTVRFILDNPVYIYMHIYIYIIYIYICIYLRIFTKLYGTIFNSIQLRLLVIKQERRRS